MLKNSTTTRGDPTRDRGRHPLVVVDDNEGMFLIKSMASEEVGVRGKGRIRERGRESRGR